MGLFWVGEKVCVEWNGVGEGVPASHIPESHGPIQTARHARMCACKQQAHTQAAPEWTLVPTLWDEPERRTRHYLVEAPVSS